MIRNLAIVTPVFDDWRSFAMLAADIAGQFDREEIAIQLCAVDDGSLARFAPEAIALPPDSCVVGVEVIRLALNLGHQRAIAVGLCEMAERPEFDAVVVMDSDGEDRPSDIASLVAASRERPDSIVLARRTKRSEPPAFRLWYRLYQLVFWLLTGQAIRFGNFALLPMSAVSRLVYMPELWNHLAASIIRSSLPYLEVPTARGARLAGRSRMNGTSLIVHGLSALSVQTDRIFVRVLLAAVGLAAVAGLGIVVVTAIRFGTDRAIPGWATTAVGDLMIILLQTLVIVVAATLPMLAGRSSRPVLPIADAGRYVLDRQRVAFGRAPSGTAAARTTAAAE